jgi:hypothetical protein
MQEPPVEPVDAADEQKTHHAGHEAGREQRRGLELREIRDRQEADAADAILRAAGEEIADDGADRRERAGDLHPGEEVRHRARNPQVAHLLHPRRLAHEKQLPEIPIDRDEAHRRVRDHGKEPDHERDRHDARQSLAEPEDEDRSKDRHRHHLQDEDVRIERGLDPRREPQRHGEQETHAHGQEEPEHRAPHSHHRGRQ